MGKSKAQDALMGKLDELYPDSFLSDEVYIGDLIEERGYSISEIAEELGNKPHKMFVDIVMRDSDRTVAFEYHGEQHYSLVGNMTKTSADLILNQQLDREKSWILTRIGIPLVAVPFDKYIDEAVIESMIDEAWGEVDDMRSTLADCPNCGRLFPADRIPYGICSRCYDDEQEQLAYEREQEELAWQDEYDETYGSRFKKPDETKEEKVARRKEEREKRKARYRAYKETPEYKQKKEAEKARRKEYNRQQREKQKQYRRQQKRDSQD